MNGFIESAVDEVERRNVTEGIVVHRLYRSDDGPNARRALFLTFVPGAQWPGDDVHEPGPEEVFVVEGEFHGLAGVGSTHSAGSFIHCDRGTSHSPFTSTGGTLFVYYPEG